MKQIISDAINLMILLLVCLGILTVTFVGILLGGWFADVVYRAGAHGNAAQWLAHVGAFLVTIAVVLSVLGRVITGSWWTE